MKNMNNLSIKDGLFYRCGHLNKLSEKESRKLVKLGIKYILDLRCDVELREQPDRIYNGLEYINIPILTAKAVGITQDTLSVKELLDSIPPMQDVYLRFAEDVAIEQIKKVMHFIINADAGVAFHCTAGKDRTGIIAYFILHMLDFKEEDIIQNYLLTNEYTKPYIRLAKVGIFLKTKKIKYVKTIHKLFVVDRSYIDAFVNEINKKFGSVDVFIKDGLGIDDEQKEKFKKKALIKN